MLANIETLGIVFSRIDALFILPLLLVLFLYEIISLMKAKKVNK